MLGLGERRCVRVSGSGDGESAWKGVGYQDKSGEQG